MWFAHNPQPHSGFLLSLVQLYDGVGPLLALIGFFDVQGTALNEIAPS